MKSCSQLVTSGRERESSPGMSLLIGNSIPSSTPKTLHMQATPRELSRLCMYICINVTRIQERRKIVLPFFQIIWKLFFWLDTKGSRLPTSLSFSLISVEYFQLSDAEWWGNYSGLGMQSRNLPSRTEDSVNQIFGTLCGNWFTSSKLPHWQCRVQVQFLIKTE